MTIQATEADRGCHSCLYMATHEPCDKCLSNDEDWAVYRATGKMPPYRYSNWTPGNWLARLLRWQRDGKQNIVIGGQGEAEVNTKQTPEAASKNLHYVAEQCGYHIGRLHKRGESVFLGVETRDGAFELEWSEGHLAHIWALTFNNNGNETERKSTWDWADADLFPSEASEPMPLTA